HAVVVHGDVLGPEHRVHVAHVRPAARPFGARARERDRPGHQARLGLDHRAGLRVDHGRRAHGARGRLRVDDRGRAGDVRPIHVGKPSRRHALGGRCGAAGHEQ
ncbi:MAG: hypothetical protein ACK559_17620, partial [bacterium]